MEILIKTLQLVLSLSILVVLHELGHFIPAKLFKTRVEKFYLFFDPWFSLFKVNKGETEYGIGWLPLGGYVKISGMIDESIDKEQMKLPAQPWEFRAKPSWQRLIIMIGGVTVNVILAMAIYSMVAFCWGDKYLPNDNLTDGIWCADSIAYEMGFKNGDKILSVDGKKPDDFRKIFLDIILNEAQAVEVLRDGEKITLPMSTHLTKEILKKKASVIQARMPFEVAAFSDSSVAKKAGFLERDRLVGINEIPIKYFDQYKSEIGKHKGESVSFSLMRGKQLVSITLQIPADGILGIWNRNFGVEDYEKEGIYQIKTVSYTMMQSIPAGISRASSTLDNYIKQFKLLFSRETEGYKQIGGFLTIGSLFSPMWDWQHFWEMTAFLSIILAFMNILPIPALDGGHVMFLLYEMIFRRKPNEKFIEYAQMAGMAVLFALLIYANGNDILRLFTK